MECESGTGWIAVSQAIMEETAGDPPRASLTNDHTEGQLQQFLPKHRWAASSTQNMRDCDPDPLPQPGSPQCGRRHSLPSSYLIDDSILRASWRPSEAEAGSSGICQSPRHHYRPSRRPRHHWNLQKATRLGPRQRSMGVHPARHSPRGLCLWMACWGH